jgi:hypothetical protein
VARGKEAFVGGLSTVRSTNLIFIKKIKKSLPGVFSGALGKGGLADQA